MKRLLLLVVAVALVAMNMRMWARAEEKKQVVVSAQSHQQLSQDFERLMQAFKKSTAFTESNVQVLINLVSVEAAIADGLLHRTGAATLEKWIGQREMYLRQAVPTVQQLYAQMLDLAAFSETLNEKVARAHGDWNVRLGRSEDQHFLRTVRDRLSNYLQSLNSAQCALSAAHNLGGYVVLDNAVAVQDGDQVVEFCPIKL